MPISRRHLLPLAAGSLLSANAQPQLRRLKVMVTGGHPGDPECGCGGTIARFADAGHEVVVLYMNRGEAYCKGVADPEHCAPMRSAEAAKACQILKARPLFLTQKDGRAVIDGPHFDDIHAVFETEKPDIIFTHWPIDTHRDHRGMSNLVLDAWLRRGKTAALFYYEVTDDTLMFSPTEFVEISSVEGRRRAACYAHASQTPDKWYPAQAELTRVRGQQSGHAQAEGFLRHWQSRPYPLP